MKDYLERIDNPLMEYYRIVYKDSKRYDGGPLDDKRVIVYMEQGFGDQIMFLRFLRFLKAKNPKQIILHAPKPLHRLIKTLGVDVINKDSAEETVLPDHDLHILSLSLPFVLRCPIPLEPYISVPEKEELPPGKFNIGITWEGSAEHPDKEYRDCPLRHFKMLQKPNVQFWLIQPATFWWSPNLIKGAELMYLKAVAPSNVIFDFYDTARLINSLDLIVSVDTACLHLAGAMGKQGYGLLSETHTDPRWKGLWYPTLTLLKGPWEESMRRINTA
jgi:hypothetical protein